MFSRDEFPDNSVEKRHLQKLYSFECLSNGKVRFYLDRQPHYFHGVSMVVGKILGERTLKKINTDSETKNLPYKNLRELGGSKIALMT